MRFICSALAILLAVFSFSAQAAAPLPSDPTPVLSNTSPPPPSPSSLQQLQWAGTRLQATLGMLQEQSEQLQLTLSALNQQMLETQLKQALAMKTENMGQLAVLRVEYQQAQNALLALRQEEALLQARMKVLTQQLTQLPNLQFTPTAPTADTPPISPATSHKKIASTAALRSAHSKITHENWIEDPVWILRVGGGCIALALVFLFFQSRKKKSARKTAKLLSLKRSSPKENMTFYMESATLEENADLTPEYDFMSTQEAIPTRLNLAKGYIEMGKLLEAREAIKPVFEHGNALQKQEAAQLLEKIEQVDMHV